jgi:SAM-dependent methyltransferase
MNDLKALLEQTPDGVVTEISPQDEMYRGPPERYFEAGRSALRSIKLGLLAAGMESPRKVLDLPCGHGRVLRVLKVAFPDAALTACDINRDGVDFCARMFGATPIYSSLAAEDVEIDDRFDLVWSGSLLTHLDLDRWHGFFELLTRCVEPGGLLVFTAFGRWPAERLRQRSFAYSLTEQKVETILRDFDAHGFGYVDYPGQTLSGMSLTVPSWIFGQLETRPELRIVSYMERGWSDHQDVVVCMREG